MLVYKLVSNNYNLLTSGILVDQSSKLPDINTSLPCPSQRNTVGSRPSPCDETNDAAAEYGSEPYTAKQQNGYHYQYHSTSLQFTISCGSIYANGHLKERTSIKLTANHLVTLLPM